jgi:hypothetical protein
MLAVGLYIWTLLCWDTFVKSFYHEFMLNFVKCFLYLLKCSYDFSPFCYCDVWSLLLCVCWTILALLWWIIWLWSF